MVINEAVSGLLLDEQNPRFPEEVNGQDAAVTALLLDAAEKLVNLARDIAQEGTLNPTELPVVVEEDKGLVVIEGNRRLAAIKLLQNPNLAETASEQLGTPLVRKFKALQQIGIGPDSIDVFQAESREAARHWIELRHTGENDGVGIIAWKTWQINNYRRKRGSQADRATMFCEAVEIDFSGDKELLANVALVRQTKLTTLGRLVADPDVRRDFGFQFIEDEVFFDYTTEDLRAAITRIFFDLSTKTDGISVTDIKTKAQRLQYVADRSEVLPNRAQRLMEPRLPGQNTKDKNPPRHDNKLGDTRDMGSKSALVGANEETYVSTSRNESLTSERRDVELPKKSGARRTPPPEKVIFQSLRTPNLNPRIRQLLAQSQQINIDDFAPICGILIRVLLELSVTEAMSAGIITKSQEQDTLKKKIRQALLALDPECHHPVKRKKELEMAWIRTQEGDALAVQSLHAFVHNIHGDAAPSEVRTLSKTFRPVLQGIDELIGSNKK